MNILITGACCVTSSSSSKSAYESIFLRLSARRHEHMRQPLWYPEGLFEKIYRLPHPPSPDYMPILGTICEQERIDHCDRDTPPGGPGVVGINSTRAGVSAAAQTESNCVKQNRHVRHTCWDRPRARLIASWAGRTWRAKPTHLRCVLSLDTGSQPGLNQRQQSLKDSCARRSGSLVSAAQGCDRVHGVGVSARAELRVLHAVSRQ